MSAKQLRFSDESSLDVPTTGDWIQCPVSGPYVTGDDALATQVNAPLLLPDSLGVRAVEASTGCYP
jgi:hypothetical protein